MTTNKFFIAVSLVLCLVVGVWLAREHFGLFSRTLKPGEVIWQEGVALPEEAQDKELEPVDYQMEVVAQGLEVPWNLVFTSSDRLLITERPGRIRVMEKGRLQDEPLLTLSDVSSRSEEGLMGLAKDPAYEQNKYLYACYAYAIAGGLQDRVVRLIDQGDAIQEDRVILDDMPAATNHAGCALSFGPDGKLYITTGDATDRNIAQDLSSLGGKILRVNPDGTIPADNPFPNSPVWSYGHRNPQGIAWHPETQLLYSTEHGPSGLDGAGGGDEINLIKAGGNYGWPLVSHDKNQQGLSAPLRTFTPAEAPASAAFYSGSVFPQFRHNLFFGALRGEGIMRAVIADADPEVILEIEKLPLIMGRVRAVAEGPDSFIYFTSSNRDGRGKTSEGDDKVYRLVPTTP